MKGNQLVFAVTNDLVYDRRMYRICTALAAGGMEVTLIGRRRRNSPAFHPANFKSRRFSCFFNTGPLFYAEYNIRLFFILLFLPFDVACACDLDTAPAVHLASRLRRKRKVYDAHEYFSEVPELTHRPVVKKIWEWIAKKTIPHFDACYTVGEELAKLMGGKYNIFFQVIRNIEPIGEETIQGKHENQRDDILLYQGALNVGRGLEAIIEAMPYLPKWTFWIAGEGDITQKLKESSQKLNLGSRIKFLGWVNPEDLPALLQQAKLNINLREKGSLNDFYSLPNKFFDAIHAGLPSVNMNYPEYANICRKYPCAVLLDEVSVHHIVSAINEVDAHPEKWYAMQDACQLAAKEYTWENESRKLVDIYQKLISFL
jgi:glycosyltransferase involved in cell wall biosynthesis